MTAAPGQPVPVPVSVTAWGERGENALPGCLRVLVGGQGAGSAERRGTAWVACWYAVARSGDLRDRVTEHATAGDAVRAVARSPWARRLGARASSPVSWSAKARRLAGASGCAASQGGGR